jgi:FKBP-type peptidyl-prolyl cis-trans isomerase
MNKVFLFFVSLTVLFAACETSFQGDGKSSPKKSADEDELIERYSYQLIADPRTQDEIDQNIILNFLIDSLFDFQKTESGIYYQIEKPGEGEHPTIQSSVIAHYRGTLMDGKEFDSSYKKGAPLIFSLDGVIPGWQEALPMLKIGGKGTFIIPSRLAYGKRGYPGLIEPNSVLIFDIELIKIR